MGRGNAASRLQQAVNGRLTLVKRASDPKNSSPPLYRRQSSPRSAPVIFGGRPMQNTSWVKINRGVSPTC